MAKKGNALSRVAAHARISLDRRPVAHFLHIGKTAGTAIAVAMKEAPGLARFRIVREPHRVTLAQIPEPDYFFFCVRDPVDRYISSFLHRELQGRPRYFLPWTQDEARAFAQFPSPDALATSLSAGGTEQRDAEAAMRTIRHVRSSYWDWFGDADYFKSRADRILWIGHQESLDLEPLASVLGLKSLELPTDPMRANKAPQPKPHLSDRARQNLQEWYARDYMFLELCRDLEPGRSLPRPTSKKTDHALLVRTMSERPFALRNADAMRVAGQARKAKYHRSAFRQLAHTARRHLP